MKMPRAAAKPNRAACNHVADAELVRRGQRQILGPPVVGTNEDVCERIRPEDLRRLRLVSFEGSVVFPVLEKLDD